MSESKATWIIELNIDCPNCKNWVDLLDYPDIFDARSFEIAEHDTEKSKDVCVVCPVCRHEFTVDLEY